MNNLILDNLQYKKTNHFPIWLMRQAGRYMIEYHTVKNKFSSFIEMCKNENALIEITLQPIQKFNFDAAIIFSDILLILDAINIKVDFIPGQGPIIDNLGLRNINSLPTELYLESVKPCYKAIQSIKNELTDRPLIGFSAAPWTLAAYYIEGRLTKDLSIIKSFSYKYPEKMDYIINLFSDLIIKHLLNQIEAGVDVIQIFDTHSYQMDNNMNKKYSIEQVKKISRTIRVKYPDIPIIYYTKNFQLDDNNIEQYIECISLNSNVNIKEQTKHFKNNFCFQGNLDPYILVEGGETMLKEVKKILSNMKDNFFIFNLGHGVLPQTPTKNVFKLIETVRNFKK